MATGRSFGCAVKLVGPGLVEVRLEQFKFAVRVRPNAECWLRLANGVAIWFLNSGNDEEIRVFLNYRGYEGQRIKLRAGSERTVSINGLRKLRDDCNRQLAAQRILCYSMTVPVTLLVHVSNALEIVQTSAGTAKAEFEDGVAYCYHGPKNSPGRIEVIYVRATASDRDFARAMFSAIFHQLPEEHWELVVAAHTDVTMAARFAALVPQTTYENYEWIHPCQNNVMERVLLSLLAVFGPRLIANRLLGRAKEFFECFRFPKKWEFDKRSWKERLAELDRNPWSYIGKYYRVRGVSSGEQKVLWISDRSNLEFEDEQELFNSTTDEFGFTPNSDVQFLLKNRTGRALKIMDAIPTLVSEPLTLVVPWYEAPATIKWTGRQHEAGQLTWRGQTVSFGKRELSERDLTPVVNSPELLAWAISDSFQVGGDLDILDVEQLYMRNQMAVKTVDKFRHNNRFTVVHVLADGDAAGVFDQCRVVCRKGSKLQLLVRNGEGDHMVLSHSSNATSEPTETSKPYRLVFRGPRDFCTCSTQSRRQSVFVERITS